MPDQQLGEQRLDYADGPSAHGLAEGDLAADPLSQFRSWYAEAVAAGVAEPNAMTLATVGADGGPTARTVLLKDADGDGLVFFTNLTSRKGTELAALPRAAVVLPWLLQHRQVQARGPVELLERSAVEAYFAERPWGSRIGAWASRQSSPLPGRDELEARWAALAARWPDHGDPGDVPVPGHWGGFRLRPVEIEFWQGRPSRLHDRLVYVAAPGTTPPLDDVRGWRVERRAP